MTTFRGSMELWGFERMELPLSSGQALFKLVVQTPNKGQLNVPHNITKAMKDSGGKIDASDIAKTSETGQDLIQWLRRQNVSDTDKVTLINEETNEIFEVPYTSIPSLVAQNALDELKDLSLEIPPKFSGPGAPPEPFLFDRSNPNRVIVGLNEVREGKEKALETAKDNLQVTKDAADAKTKELNAATAAKKPKAEITKLQGELKTAQDKVVAEKVKVTKAEHELSEIRTNIGKAEALVKKIEDAYKNGGDEVVNETADKGGTELAGGAAQPKNLTTKEIKGSHFKGARLDTFDSQAYGEVRHYDLGNGKEEFWYKTGKDQWVRAEGNHEKALIEESRMPEAMKTAYKRNAGGSAGLNFLGAMGNTIGAANVPGFNPALGQYGNNFAGSFLGGPAGGFPGQGGSNFNLGLGSPNGGYLGLNVNTPGTGGFGGVGAGGMTDGTAPGGFTSIDMMVERSGFENARKARKLDMILQILMSSIMMGNIDAIANAMTMIGLKSKNTLVHASMHMLAAMNHYEKKTDEITKRIAEISKDQQPNAAKLQMEMANLSSYSSARQAITNSVRDVMSMVEEITTLEKSLYDKKDRDAQFYRWG